MKLSGHFFAQSNPAVARRPTAIQPCRAAIFGALLSLGMAAGSVSAASNITVEFIPYPGTSSNPFRPTISADGRYIAFKSIPGGQWTGDIYVHDRVTGNRIQANQKLDGTTTPGGHCDVPAISADGRAVVFACPSVEMGIPTQGQGYFVYDRINQKTEVVAVTIPGVVGISGSALAGSVHAGISPDGRYIAYRNWLSGSSTLMLRDRINNTNLATSGHSSFGGINPSRMDVGVGGRYISYQGREKPSSTFTDMLVYDHATGITDRVNVNNAGVRDNSGGSDLSMSEDGNIAVFRSSSTKLVATNFNTAFSGHIYMRNRSAGTTEMVSGNVSGTYYYPSLSANGRYIAFYGAPTGTKNNLYVYDRLTKTRRILPITVGDNSGYRATYSSFSADGRYLVFEYSNSKRVEVYIGVADLGVAPGLALSTDALALTEGGAAGTYTLALTQPPTADVTVTLAPDQQQSTSVAQLVFTPENWNTPQTVSVQALQDNIAEGKHSGTITHSVASADVDYSVVTPAAVTVAISDAIIPTITLPGTVWGQPDLPVTGTAAPGATVLLTAINRTTGTLSSASIVADSQGNWSRTLFGLNDGVYDLEAEADAIKSEVKSITVALSKPALDVTALFTLETAGLVQQLGTVQFTDTYTITNISGATIAGPFHLQFDGMPADISLANADGSHAGAPFLTANVASLAPGASIAFPVVLNNPAMVDPALANSIYAGDF